MLNDETGKKDAKLCQISEEIGFISWKKPHNTCK